MIYFYSLLAILFLVIIIFSAIQFFNIVFRGFAPFISTKFNVILTILKELDLDGSETVYELGAGRAGFLRAIEQKFKNRKLFGVEYAWWPYVLARIQIALSRSSIEMIRKDIFSVNLKSADLIYCFLNAPMMRRLEKKIKEECRPDTVIISYCFTFPNLIPEKIIKEGDNNIYFYQI